MLFGVEFLNSKLNLKLNTPTASLQKPQFAIKYKQIILLSERKFIWKHLYQKANKIQ